MRSMDYGEIAGECITLPRIEAFVDKAVKTRQTLSIDWLMSREAT